MRAGLRFLLSMTVLVLAFLPVHALAGVPPGPLGVTITIDDVTEGPVIVTTDIPGATITHLAPETVVITGTITPALTPAPLNGGLAGSRTLLIFEPPPLDQELSDYLTLTNTDVLTDPAGNLSQDFRLLFESDPFLFEVPSDGIVGRLIENGKFQLTPLGGDENFFQILFRSDLERVPVPSSLALFAPGLGLLGLALTARRRRDR